MTTLRTRILADRSRDIINFEDYAPQNSVDAINVGWSDLWADYPTGNIIVNFSAQRGLARVNAPLTLPSGVANVELRFGGKAGFCAPQHGFNVLTFGAGNYNIEMSKPRFVFGSAATGSTSYWCLLNGAQQSLIRDFRAEKYHSGIYQTGPKGVYDGLTYLQTGCAGYGTGVVIQQPTGVEEALFNDLMLDNAAGQEIAKGVFVRSGSAIRVKGQAWKCVTPLFVAPQNGEVIATLSLDFNGDTSTGHGAHFVNTGTGVCQRVEGFLRVSSNAGDGVWFQHAPRSADLTIRAVDNGVNGARWSGGQSFHNGRYRLAAFGNAVHGGEILDGVRDITIEAVTGAGDDFGGNGNHGFVIGAGCDHFTVDVDGVGDAIALLYNGSGTSAAKVVRARN